jgi:hypothetical protein
MTTGRILAAAAALISALALVGTASAQYPEPKGSLVCTTTVNVQISETTVSATLRDSRGQAVVGQDIGFWIISGDGSLSDSSAETDGSGTASVTLYDAANTSVGAVYDGLECSAVTQILGQTFRPPSTGDAGLLGQGSDNSNLVLGFSLGVMGLSATGLVIARRRLAAVKND